MRNSFHHILICCLALFFMSACQKNVIEMMENPLHGAITLRISANNVPLETRATYSTEPTAAEKAISHLDVVIFDAVKSGDKYVPGTLFYHEYVDVSSKAGNGTITLKKLRSEFPQNAYYYVYLIANCTYLQKHDSSPVTGEREDVSNAMFSVGMEFAKFRTLTQYDLDIDLTGSGLPGISNNYFLMDGSAYKKGGSEPTVRTEAAILELNDGIEANNTELEVNLRRAAAKILVFINPGENVRFDNDELKPDNTSKGSVRYYFQHLTTETYLTPPDKVLGEDGRDNTNKGMHRESGWEFMANDKYLRLTSETLSNAPEKPDPNNRGQFLANNYVKAIEVQGYAYAQDWNHETIGYDTKLVVNLPMWLKSNDGVWSEDIHGDNYYQIPLSKGNKLERNRLYVVEVTVDALGSASYETAVELKDVTYNVIDWKDVLVEVGSSSQDMPVFLSLNEHEIPMYHGSSAATGSSAPVDADMTLQFSSSSAVTVEIVNWYYEDADGKRQYRYGTASGSGSNRIPAATNGNDNTDENGNEVPAGDAAMFKYALDSKGDYIINPTTYDSATKHDHTVTLYDPANPNTPAQKVTLADLNGSIKINSTTPSNFAIRYIILRISNADTGVDPQYVVYAHYPQVYVTHETGWYSYRKDFGGTSWEFLNNTLSLDGDLDNNTTSNQSDIYDTNKWRCGCSWNDNNNQWTYTKSSSGFFRNKVVIDGEIRSAGWTRNTSWGFWIGTYSRTDDSYSLQNPRMYHIQVSATDKTYTIGVPKKTDGITNDDADNQLLVSPSFMLASQLGGSQGGSLDKNKETRKKQAADHCNQYVEVYKDENGNAIHLDDWRLPTQAEIKFIIDTQYAPSSPLAEVLSGDSSISATGDFITNTGPNTSSGNGIRCVRDAYVTPAGSPTPIVKTQKSSLDSNNDGLRPNN